MEVVVVLEVRGKQIIKLQEVKVAVLQANKHQDHLLLGLVVEAEHKLRVEMAGPHGAVANPEPQVLSERAVTVGFLPLLLAAAAAAAILAAAAAVQTTAVLEPMVADQVVADQVFTQLVAHAHKVFRPDTVRLSLPTLQVLPP